jgi:Zn-dependent metalloprotease
VDRNTKGKTMNTHYPEKKMRGTLVLLGIVVWSVPAMFGQQVNVRVLNLPPDIDAAVKTISGADVAAATAGGIPTFVRGNFGKIQAAAGVRATAGDVAPLLARITPLFRLVPSDLRVRRERTDSMGLLHVDYDQTKNGLPVIGTRLSVHVTRDGTVYAVTGNAHDGENLPSVAAIPSLTAAARVRLAQRVDQGSLTVEPRRLVYVVSTKDQTMHLAQEIVVQADNVGGLPLDQIVYVDALTGETVDVHSRVLTALSRTVKNANFQNSIGSTVRTEGSSASGNATYDTNYDYLGNTYSYYSSKFGRDSIDGSGLALVSTVNFRANSTQPYNNAFWYSPTQQMVYGDGDGTVFSNLVFANDVTSHELTHGVTEHESGLIYANEPGALNEAFSDIFGAASETSGRNPSPTIDSKTWQIGEDIYTPSAPGDALRYMDNPTADGQSKDYYPERGVLNASAVPDPVNNDWGYVHTNSGIINLAFKLMVTGGQHPRQGQYSAAAGGYIPTMNTSPLDSTALLSMARAEQIFYRANTVYLGPGAQFIDARAATVQSALDLGYGSGAASSISTIWDVVGVPTFSNRYPINISTRANIGTGSNAMIAGFVLNGGGSSKTLLIRGIGPTLSSYGLSGVMANPELTLFDGSSTNIGYNDDWSSSGNASAIASAASSVGAFSLPNPSYDSAMLATLASGNYSAQVNGVSGGTGIGLVEVYDTDFSNPNHLVNISTRAHVGTGADAVVAGFVINGSGNKYLLIRGIGPTLSSFGLSGVLSDPKLELFDSSSTKIRQNDDWRYDENGNDLSATIVSITSTVGAFSLPANSRDSVLLVSLPAGNYSVALTGVSGGTGLGMIEVYEVN